MSRDVTFRYSVQMTLATGYATPAGWPTRNRIGDLRPKEILGTPNDAKLARYVADYNDSLIPDGVNSHIGQRGRCVAAVIVDHNNKDTVVARWSVA